MSEMEPDFLDDPALSSTSDDDAAPTAPPPPEPAPTAEATPPPAATAAPDVKKDDHVPLAALMAEREKRQRLERELAEVRQAAPPMPQVDFYQQPDVYVQQHLQSVEVRTTARMFAALEDSAREQFPDYDDVTGPVIEQAHSNPALAQQIVQSGNPALAAYKLGKQMAEMERMRDPAAYRAQIEAEVRQKVEAELAAKAQKAAAVPPDLSDNRNAKGQFTSPSGDVFKDIF